MCSWPISVTALRLLEEALDDFLVAGELAVDDLERDLLADQRVLGEIDGAHPAGPDLVQDAVAADRLAGADQVRPIVALLQAPADFLSGLSGPEVHRPDMGTIGAEKSDGELVEASRRGEHEAFGQLVARYQDLVCAVSYSSTGDRVLSEDVAQETFIAAWRQLDGLRDIERLRSWLCGIARNLARKARKAHRRDELVEDSRSDRRGQSVRRRRACARSSGSSAMRSGGCPRRIARCWSCITARISRSARSRRRSGSSEAAVMQRLSRGRRYLADSVTALVERSLRGRRARAATSSPPCSPRSRSSRSPPCRCLSTAQRAKRIDHVQARHRRVGRSPPPAPPPISSTRTTRTTRTRAAGGVADRGTPALHYGAGKLGLAHALALGPTAAPQQIQSRSVAESDLGLLPADSDAVIGINVAQLQQQRAVAAASSRPQVSRRRRDAAHVHHASAASIRSRRSARSRSACKGLGPSAARRPARS